MKLGIMQPYFFPYLGYFAIIKHTNKFVLLDTVQFIRHGWIERNRILKPGGGWQYFSIPLQKHKRETLIKDIHIRNNVDWKLLILRQIEHYKKKAPFYNKVIELFNKIFAKEFYTLVDFNVETIKELCMLLHIDSDLSVFSEMNIELNEIKDPDDWALEISKELGAKTYINPPGGISFFNKSKYDKNNIELHFLQLNLSEYRQYGLEFIPGLSIIDVAMFCSIEKINIMLDDYKLI